MMDDLANARRKWKRAEDAVEEAKARLKAAGGNPEADAARAVTHARKELEEAGDEERRGKRNYRKLKTANGG
jgi:F0F1-type ATP synthase membrane subunit b/b'